MIQLTRNQAEEIVNALGWIAEENDPRDEVIISAYYSLKSQLSQEDNNNESTI